MSWNKIGKKVFFSFSFFQKIEDPRTGIHKRQYANTQHCWRMYYNMYSQPCRDFPGLNLPGWTSRRPTCLSVCVSVSGLDFDSRLTHTKWCWKKLSRNKKQKKKKKKRLIESKKSVQERKASTWRGRPGKKRIKKIINNPKTAKTKKKPKKGSKKVERVDRLGVVIEFALRTRADASRSR